MAEEKQPSIEVDKILTRGGGSVIIALMVWMNTSMTGIVSEVSAVKQSLVRVTTELEIVSPRDLRADIEKLPSRTEVEKIISQSAPWTTDKPEWQAWRSTVEKRLHNLEMDRR